MRVKKFIVYYLKSFERLEPEHEGDIKNWVSSSLLNCTVTFTVAWILHESGALQPQQNKLDETTFLFAVFTTLVGLFYCHFSAFY